MHSGYNLPGVAPLSPNRHQQEATSPSTGSSDIFAPSSRAVTLFCQKAVMPPSSATSCNSSVTAACLPKVVQESVTLEIDGRNHTVNINHKLFNTLTHKKSKEEVNNLVMALKSLEIMPVESKVVTQKGFR